MYNISRLSTSVRGLVVRQSRLVNDNEDSDQSFKY